MYISFKSCSLGVLGGRESVEVEQAYRRRLPGLRPL